MNVHFNSSVSSQSQKLIKEAIVFADTVLQKYFSFDQEIDLYFYCSSEASSDKSLTGETYESGVVFCRLLSDTPDQDELLNFLFHELNHAKRNQLFSTEKNPTLFNWLLLEGLAQTFEKQVAQDLNFSWQKFFIPQTATPLELKTGLASVLRIDDEGEAWNYYDWFYNFDRQAELPVNFAYQLGDFLVSEYCRAHKITASQALLMPSQEFESFAREVLCKK